MSSLPDGPTAPEDLPAASSDHGRRVRQHLSKRARVLLSSAVSLVVLLLVALLLPVPFVRMAPGPTFNVIGDLDGKPIIGISGTQTFPTTGELQMTTVLESGGPRGGLTFIGALASWFNATDAVVPRELIYPDDITGDAVQSEQAAMFSSSESDAIAAAMGYLDVSVTNQLVVSVVSANAPASGRLQAGDIIIAVDGKPAGDAAAVTSLIRQQPVGTTFTFTVDRDGRQQDVQVTSAANPVEPQVPYIGISIGTISTPAGFDVDFNVDGVGGPSAGLMLTVGLIDKLTPGDLAAGRSIAGTGTIKPDGTVGPIGGIRQKLAGASATGAELFLMPASHCKEAAGHVPAGLTVTPVQTLAEAVHAIEAWTAGTSIPACPVQP
ncbi:MAG: PDZ domain-containing protein [Candidatus Nanopelagicales bacterium]